MNRWHITAAAIALLAGWSVAAQDLVDARADRLSVDHRAGTALFEGHVRLQRAEMTLTCDRLRVSYDKSGNITSLEASGAVVVRTDDGEARAGRARLNVKTNRLVLTENPQVKQDGGTLTGRRIEVDLNDAQMQVFDAHGTFRFRAAR